MNVAAFIDARSPDPTGTAGLRRSFRAAGKLRMQMFRTQMRQAVVEHDVLGLAGGGLALQPPETKLRAFNGWARTAADQALGGPWLSEWIARAWASGEAVGALQTRSLAPGEGSGAWAELARVELEAISAAVVQGITREAAIALTKRRSNKVMTWRRMARAFDKIGPRRIMALANTFTVGCHNRGRLAAYRAAGITKVGVIPERLLPKQALLLPGGLGDCGSARSARSARGSARSALDAKHIGYKELGPARPEYELSKVEEPIEVGVRTAGDEFVCIECDAFAENSPHDIDDVEDTLPIHPNCRCVLPGMMVEGEVLLASKAWYSGEAVEIVTAGGKRLSLTVNHPVLTARGEVAAGDLRKGMQLVGKVGSGRLPAADVDNGPARIEDVFEALSPDGIVEFRPSAVDLHGEGKSIKGNVQLVFADASLMRDFDAEVAKRGEESLLEVTDAAGGSKVSSSDSRFPGALAHLVPLQTFSIGDAARADAMSTQALDHGHVRGSDLACELFGGDAAVIATQQTMHGRPFDRWTALLDAFEFDVFGDDLGGRSGLLVNFSRRHSIQVETDDVVDLCRFQYTGHVYDLQTATGYIFAEGLAIANCTWFPWDDRRFKRDAVDPHEIARRARARAMSQLMPQKYAAEGCTAEHFAEAEIELGDVGDEFFAMWDEKIGMEPSEFKQTFLGGADATMSIKAGRSTLTIEGEFPDTGRYVRILDLDGKEARHEYLEISVATKAVGKQVIAGNVAIYRQIGLAKVALLANIDVGGYAWAKYGFVPTAETWSALLTDLRDRIEKLPTAYKPDQSMLKAMTKGKDPKAIWAVADSEYGEYLLLGTQWEGELDLNDKAATARFDGFLGSGDGAG